MAIRIGIAGITGRMGHLLVEEVRAAGADLAGGVGRPGSGKPAPDGVELLPDIAALAAASDVVIDFTNAATAQPTATADGRGRARPGCSARRASPRPTRRRWRAAAERSPSRLRVELLGRRQPGAGAVRADGRGPAGRCLRRRDHGDAPPPEGRRAVGHRGRHGPRGGQGSRRGAVRCDGERPARPHRRAQDRRASASRRCAAARWWASTR